MRSLTVLMLILLSLASFGEPAFGFSSETPLVRPEDIPTRYGGEEFAIIFYGISADKACGIISRIRRRLAETALTCDGQEIRFTISCGISDTSGLEPDDISCESMLKKADERLYHAKNTGRDRIIGPGPAPDNRIK